MCLAVPVKIKELKEKTAIVEVDGVTVEVSTNLYKNLKIGDYVLVHAGFIIDRVQNEELEETLKTFEEYRAIMKDIGHE